MQKTWTTSDAQRLKALRERGGTDQAVFAKRYALSMGQVRELEGAGQGSFYSDSIKAHVGRKLLAALGYVEPPEPEPEPTEPISRVLPEQQAVRADPQQAWPLTIPVRVRDLTPEQESEPKPVQPAPQVEADAAPPTEPSPVEPSPIDSPPLMTSEPVTSPVPDAPPRRASLAIPLTVGVAVAALAVAWVVNSPRPTRISETSVTPAVAAEQPASAPADAVEATAAAPMPAASSAGVAVAKLPAGCEPASTREPTRYQSPVADKPATYVYVESTQEARVCVFDSQNQARVAVLKAGESFKLSGTAPFTVRSAQWADLKVFFQGLRVQLEPGAVTDNVVILPRAGG